MTSRNLSFSEKLRNHKKYVTRTLWTSIIGIVLMSIYYFVGTVLMVSRSINYAQVYHQSAYTLQQAKYNAVCRVMGFEQIGFAITFFIAVAFAFQGFSYLFDQKKLDFYLSQPTTRAHRLWENYFSAFSTYLFIYLVIMAISMIIAAAFGAVNGVVIATVLLEMVRNIIFFFAIYNITLLAILLSGTMPIAILVLFYMLAVSVFAGYMIYLYEGIFYSTFSYSESVGIWASPVYDRISVVDTLKRFADTNGYYTDFAGFFKSLKTVLPGTVDTLAVGIVVLILVVVFSRFRRAEHAGHTIVYRPFRWFVKISVCMLAGLSAGYVVFTLYNYVWNDRLFTFMIAVMIIATMICGCVVEAIMEANIKKLLAGKAQTLMAVALVALVFVVMKGDLLGFDSYLPDASKVESCALIGGDMSCMVNYEYLDENADNMKITDVETFLKLAEMGMEAQRESLKLSRNNEYRDLGWSDVTALYRLKSGRKVYRRITIPYDIDTRIMSKIIDSKEYKEGYFAVFFDDEIRKFDEVASKRNVRYESATGYNETATLPYVELSDAYRKDILEHYNFGLASNELPIGDIEYTSYIPDVDGNRTNFVSYDLKVYSNFENTISLLKKYGIYSNSFLDVEYIESVSVTNYYPGYDTSKMEQSEIYDINVESKTVYYEDRKQINEILACSYGSPFYGRWFNYTERFDDQYSIEITVTEPRRQHGLTTVYYTFELGKVPEFVIKDTN